MGRMSEIDRQLQEAEQLGGLLDPSWPYHGTATHGTSDAFRDRQIARGLRPSDRQQQVLRDQQERDERALRALDACRVAGAPMRALMTLASELRLESEWREWTRKK